MSGCLHIQRPLSETAGVKFELRAGDRSRVGIGREGQQPVWLTFDEAKRLRAEIEEFFSSVAPRKAGQCRD